MSTANVVREKRTSAAGFSLVEVLVAALILAIALLALSSLFVLGLKNNAVSKEDTVMAALAQDKLEQMKRLSRDSVENLFTVACRGSCATCANICYPSGCTALVASGLEDPIADPNPQDEVRERLYVRQWAVEKVNLGQPVGCVYKVTVTVGSRGGLLQPTPTSGPRWIRAAAAEVIGKTNARRVVLATYRK